MRRIAVPAIVVAVCVALSACGSSSPSTPKAAALAQKSVHWTAADQEQMEGETDWAADVNANSGRARVTWDFEDLGGTLDLVQVNNIVYVHGDSDSLEYFLDLQA